MKKIITREEYRLEAMKDLLAKTTRISKIIKSSHKMDEPDTLSLDSLLSLKSQLTDE